MAVAALAAGQSSFAAAQGRPHAATASRMSGSSSYVVALSNSFTGNNWRKTMVQAWTDAANAAVKQGIIKSYKVVNTPDNSATEQISQIQSLILEHVNAIDIDAASGTALNSVIQQACTAGIKVVVFDSLASAPCEYNLEDNVTALGTAEGEHIAQAIHGKGNVIVVRGVVGSAPELIDYDAQLAVLKKYPKIKIVATVTGQSSASVTQQVLESVLPSLPTIAGVVDDGVGDGVYAAFKHAGLPLPALNFGCDGLSLREFALVNKQKGYQGDAAAIEVNPGMGTAALWEAVDLLQSPSLDGKTIPKTVSTPVITVTSKTLPQWIKVTPATGVATWTYSRAETNATILANINHRALPIPPVPGSSL